MAEHEPQGIHQLLYDVTNPLLFATVRLPPDALLVTLTLAERGQEVTWQIDAQAAVMLGGVLTELLRRGSTPPARP